MLEPEPALDIPILKDIQLLIREKRLRYVIL